MHTYDIHAYEMHACEMHNCKMHAYKIHDYKRCKLVRCTLMRYIPMRWIPVILIFRKFFDLSLTAPMVLLYRSAYHCVGWHAAVCYGAPEWFRGERSEFQESEDAEPVLHDE